MEDRLDRIDWNITLIALNDNWEPMAWNLFLAFIPLVLSCLLFNPTRSLFGKWIWLLFAITIIGSYRHFKSLLLFLSDFWLFLGSFLTVATIGVGLLYLVAVNKQTRTLFWWLGTGIFILFLPNAAYVLTDLIHLVLDIRKGYPMATVILFLIPQYLIFIVAGFQAYVISIMNLETYLLKQNITPKIWLVEIGIHILSALGVYLGRFARFNSWDAIAHFDRLLETTENIFLSLHSLITIAVIFSVLAVGYLLFKTINLSFVDE